MYSRKGGKVPNIPNNTEINIRDMFDMFLTDKSIE